MVLSSPLANNLVTRLHRGTCIPLRLSGNMAEECTPGLQTEGVDTLGRTGEVSVVLLYVLCSVVRGEQQEEALHQPETSCKSMCVFICAHS